LLAVRLLYTIPDYWPYVRRGSERIVHDLSASMATRGHQVRVVTRTPEGRGETRHEDGFEIRYVAPNRTRERVLGLDAMEGFALTAAGAAIAHDSDVYHAFYLSDAYGLSQVARVRRRPFVVSWQGYTRKPWWQETHPRTHDWIIKAMERATAVVVLSDFAGKRLLKDWGVESVVLHPGVFCDDYSQPRTPPSRPTIVCAAAVDDPRKRMSTLVEALPLLLTDVPDVKLVLIGPGDPGELRRQATELGTAVLNAIEFREVTSQMADVYASCTVGALTSYEEAFGMSVLEYLASGMPAVVSDPGGGTEIISPGTGIAFAHGDAEACASALRQALDLALLEGTEARCRARAREFDWSVRATAYETLYGRVAAGL
jgi:glycosyltransferase involved in cell wall biosynthesis